MATYACTDLHGQKDLLVKIQKFLQPDDVVFFLGDAADRGAHGWEMIKMIAQDKRFIPIKGNHEDMLIDAARSYYPDERIGHGFSLLASNGGKVTFYDMTNDQWGEQWINHIRKYPTHAEYTNTQGQLVLLSHAGYTPYYDEEDGGIGIWHNREIHDHHIEELWWSPSSLPNITKEDIDWFFEYIEERWIKYKGTPSGVVGNSEVLLSEDEDFVV